MIALIARTKPARRRPPRRQLGLPFRADQPPPRKVDGPEHIGAILLRLLDPRGPKRPRIAFDPDR